MIAVAPLIVGLVALYFLFVKAQASDRQRERSKIEEDEARPLWNSEDPVRKLYGKANAYFLYVVVALLFFVGSLFAGMHFVQLGEGQPLIRVWGVLIILSGTSITLAVFAYCVWMTCLYGVRTKFVRPFLSLTPDTCVYLDLVQIPWNEVIATRAIEVVQSRSGPRHCVLLFLKQDVGRYAVGHGPINRLRLIRLRMQASGIIRGLWPLPETNDCLVVDADQLREIVAPRLRVWMERLRA